MKYVIKGDFGRQMLAEQYDEKRRKDMEPGLTYMKFIILEEAIARYVMTA